MREGRVDVKLREAFKEHKHPISRWAKLYKEDKTHWIIPAGHVAYTIMDAGAKLHGERRGTWHGEGGAGEGPGIFNLIFGGDGDDGGDGSDGGNGGE